MWTRYAPIARGRDRLAALAIAGTRLPPASVTCRTVDGRRLTVDPACHTYRSVYFKGTYEPAVSALVTRLLRPGDVCLDVGANIGWYTTLCARCVAPSGTVHAFEPQADTFEALRRNVALLPKASAAVVLNDCALGDRQGDARVHVFAELPNGHTSLGDFGRADATPQACELTTVDAYLARRGGPPVTFVKLDIEGSELSCLRGAGRLFAQAVPPLWIVEMALATTRGFGYTPNDLVRCFRDRGVFDFYTIDEIDGALTALDGFAPHHPGAYVLCVPRGHFGDRLAGVIPART